MSDTPNPRLSQGGLGGNGLLEFERPLARIERQIEELEASQAETGRDYGDTIRAMRAELVNALKKTYSRLAPWEIVLVARHPRRPLVTDYLAMLGKDFCELHGDRNFRDDKAIVTGLVRITGRKVMLIGNRKGRDTKEKIDCCFGCAHPEGYRKAMRAMGLAAKFKLPIVSIIDTSGAYPGIGAEERGQAQAIAQSMFEMSRLPVPIVAVVIGEGGSGGALATGVADRIGMMEYAYYSVIPPEGCAAILWRSGEFAAEAAAALKPTARELKRLGIIDEIIREPLGGAHRDPQLAAVNVEKFLTNALNELVKLSAERLLKRRWERLREMCKHFEPSENGVRLNGKKPARAQSNGRSKTQVEAQPLTDSPKP
jgi:acetyl-CoA carboxylase carboxyl transferase subunit alpha